MSPGLIVLLLSLLLGLQPVTTDLYLPALPALTEGFGASMAQAQLTLTALLLSFGLSQLVWGPLSSAAARCCCGAWWPTWPPRWAARWPRRWTC
jgi:DHA1 family bicyclomycin/chloramphenicol resistance-like MFS transporter